MARIFITGSADGLGKLAAARLVAEGHRVVLHGRTAQRAAEAMAAVPGAESALAGDLSSMAQTRALADQVNAIGNVMGRFDAVIHNAGVGYRERQRNATEDGLPLVFAVNTLAPYLLTAMIETPRRLVYLSSGLHRSGDASLHDLEWRDRAWSGGQAYADSKLHDALIAFAAARHWPAVRSNALEPGWVPTKMGGKGAPDDLAAGAATQCWLAVSEEAAAQVSGEYFYHQQLREPLAAVRDEAVQERLLAACARLSGVKFPV
jgi:NAD(P)-dependent dehydrogenase (short-subunit alcohol dehydrogenase family)